MRSFFKVSGFIILLVAIVILLYSIHTTEILKKASSLIGDKGVVGLLTAIAGLIATFLKGRIKLGIDNLANKLKYEFKYATDEIKGRQDKIETKIDKLASEWDSIKKVKAVKAGFKKQMLSVSSTSMNYFKIDFTLKKYASFLSEKIIDFSYDIQNYDLKNINMDIIDQKLVVMNNMIERSCVEMLGVDFAIHYISGIYLSEVEILKSKIEYILNDKDNDKSLRLHKEMCQFLKNSLSELLQTYLESCKK